MRVLRLIKGVTLRNEDIRAELQVKSILLFIEEAQLRWYGHVIVRRMSTSRTALKWLEWKPNTARSRGRPRKQWTDKVKEAVEVRGSTVKEIEQSTLFLDISQWKNFVTDRPYAYQHCGTRSLNIWPVWISAWVQDL